MDTIGGDLMSTISPKTREQSEKGQREYWLRKKKLGMRAFVARPCSGVGSDRSVVLAGNEDNGWFQTIKFWNGNHRERAAAFVTEFNEHVVSTKKHGRRTK